MRDITLTCETDGCSNKDLPIVMTTDATQYMCGACGQFITNVKESADAGTIEAE